MRTTFYKVCALAILLLVLTTMGCKKLPDIVVSVDPGLRKTASVTVHLMGITWFELEEWKGKSIDKYWSPGNPEREQGVARKQTDEKTFARDLQAIQVLRKSDPIWKRWEKVGADTLLVIANIPGLSDKGRDPRMLYFSFKELRGGKMGIDVLPTGLRKVGWSKR